MGYVSYIGRVGALAVALGVGSAVATMPGVALAGPSDSGSSSSGSPGSSASSSTDSGGQSSASATTSDADSSSLREASSTSSKTDSSASAGSSATPDPRTGIVQSSGGAHTSAIASDTDLKPALPDDDNAFTALTAQPTESAPAQTLTDPPAGPPSAADGNDAPDTSLRSASLPASTSLMSEGDPASSVPIRLSQIAPGPTAGLSPAVLASTSTGLLAPQPKPPAPTSGPSAPPNIITDVVSTVLGLVGLGPSMIGSPVVPVDPLLWALMGWARREFEPTMFNLTAAAGAQQLSSLTVDSQDSAAIAGAVMSPNLLVNPGAEDGDPSLSGYASVTLPGWIVTGTPTVIQYGTQRRFPSPFAFPGPTLPAFLGFPSSSSAPPGSGVQFFGGGPVATSNLTQYVDLSTAAAEIDQGNVPYELSGDLGGFVFDPAAASVTVAFADSNGAILGTGTIGPVTGLDRFFQTGFIHRASSGTVPAGTRTAIVDVTLADSHPVFDNNSYADNLSFRVGAAVPAPPPPEPPVSTVGRLDHVFMVYMENKGFTNIVGSPNAPYLNSLIDTYGLGTNYFGITHPSDPNYYPIIGGSDFGVNWNCPADCFDVPNLVDNVEAAGLNWAGYAEGGGGYADPTDRLPFLAFSDIFNDPVRVESHIFDISQMGVDLHSPATAPNYVWFAANEDFNMEGPLDFPFGLLNFVIGFLDPRHQYNVKAGDEWLSEHVPVIMNSNTWQDPTRRSAIFITFDEDFNNLSTGVGNEGNRIVMVVIPSPGAVSGGMRSGHFLADDYNNHYSLLRTIELALGLPPLTNNDKFAYPMNEYWLS